jgi:CDP-glucose 4,6-dehydratase
MAKVVASFWKEKKVFLTGHTGFKGAWLSLWLTQMGAKVTGYALSAPSTPSLFEEAQISKQINSIHGDVSDFEMLAATVKKERPDIVIHMAAQSLVRHSFENPIETYQTNVMGTVGILEASRQVDSIGAVVNITSDKCYQNNEWHWGYRENEPMGGYDPYSSSKGCSELVTSAYLNSFYKKSKCGLASARAGNVIGGGDWAKDRLIPDIARSISGKNQVVIRNPHSIRPWQHVLEPLSGYLVLAQKLYENPSQYSEAFNFGPRESDAHEVSWIVQKMMNLWPNSSGFKIENSENNPHEAKYLKLDCSKSKAVLNWEPVLSLEKSLSLTTDWFRQYYSKEATAYELTINQIKEYSKLRT